MFEALMGRIAGRFARVESRRRARSLVSGLLADLPRKNCWTLAEYAGDSTPHGMQQLLARAVWDADAVRDDVRAHVMEQLGDKEAVLVVDETGDLKKGTATVGVQRQYTGTTGRIENAQVAAFLVYAGKHGHAAIDRELYVPRCWIQDRARCAAAGQSRADALAKRLPRRAWQTLSAGAGAKGQRLYDWAVIHAAEKRPGVHQLLIRRNRRTGELAFYRCYTSHDVPLSALVRVAGRRWAIEETFQSAKGLTGLDRHQVRRWTSWYRWVTLAILAHAFLALVRAHE